MKMMMMCVVLLVGLGGCATQTHSWCIDLDANVIGTPIISVNGCGNLRACKDPDTCDDGGIAQPVELPDEDDPQE